MHCIVFLKPVLFWDYLSTYDYNADEEESFVIYRLRQKVTQSASAATNVPKTAFQGKEFSAPPKPFSPTLLKSLRKQSIVFGNRRVEFCQPSVILVCVCFIFFFAVRIVSLWVANVLPIEGATMFWYNAKLWCNIETEFNIKGMLVSPWWVLRVAFKLNPKCPDRSLS